MTPPDAEPTAPRKKAVKLLILFGKIAFTIGALALVFSQIDMTTLGDHLRTIPSLYLLSAFAVLNLSQIISAFRMRYYFSSAGHRFSVGFSIMLYYITAFYNILLPGGISGDGYKAYILKRDRQIPILTSLRLILSERANGLFLLLILAIGFATFGATPQTYAHAHLLLLITFLLLIPAYLFSVKFVLKESVPAAIGASRFSAFSQSAIALCAALLLFGLGVNGHTSDYLALFMLSCVVAILPISIGGAGLRELTFLYGSPLLSLEPERGVALALAFFAIHVSTSLVGLIFLGQLRRFRR